LSASGGGGAAGGLETGALVAEFSLRRITHNRRELDHFRAFLADNFAGADDLDCWLDIDALRRTEDRKTRRARARLVVRKYFNDRYFYGPSSPADKRQQDSVLFIYLFIHSFVYN